MRPDVEFSVSPEGRDGATVQFEDAPPEFVGLRAVIAELTIPLMVEDPYEMFGAARDAVTSRLIVVLPEPAELVAVTV